MTMVKKRNNKPLIIVGVSIVVVIFFILVFFNATGGSVGKAAWSTQGAIYYASPSGNSCSEGELIQTGFGGSQVCCPNSNGFCGYDAGCYYEGSSIKILDVYDNEIEIVCDESKWVECESQTKISPSRNYLCENGVWQTNCQSDEVWVESFSDNPNNYRLARSCCPAESICVTNEGHCALLGEVYNDAFICKAGGDWGHCDENVGSSDVPPNYVCENSQWVKASGEAGCTAEEHYVIADFPFYTEEGTREGCCDESTDCPTLTYGCSNIGEIFDDNNLNLICGPESDWYRCGSKYVGEDILDRYICEEDATVKNGFLDGYIWNLKAKQYQDTCVFDKDCDQELGLTCSGGQCVCESDSQSWIVSKKGDKSKGACCTSENECVNIDASNVFWWINLLTNTNNDLCSIEKTILDSDICITSNWVDCNSDNKWDQTDDYSHWCDGNTWTNEFKISPKDFYEVKIVEDAIGKTIDAYEHFSNFRVCSSDIGMDEIDLCTFVNDNNDQLSIKSNKLLNEAGLDGVPKEFGDLLFLYRDTSKPKTASIHLLEKVPDKFEIDHLFDRNAFFTNMENGRSLALRLDGESVTEYYLLSSEVDSAKGDFGSLFLTRIPTGEVFEAESIPNNRYQFKVQGDLAVIIERSGQSVYIYSGPHEEALAFVPDVYKIETNYEIPFTRENPIQLDDLKGVTVTICADDEPKNEQSMKVCVNSDHIFNPNLNTLQNEVIEGQPVSFLYQKVGDKKQGYIFQRKIVTKDELEVNYDKFFNNIPDGKRLALTIENDGGEKVTYLVEHPNQAFFNMGDVSFTYYDGGNPVPANASGSTKSAEFNVKDGKFKLEQGYENPETPFKVSFQTNEELRNIEINLTEELFTTISTFNPVNLIAPFSFGVLAVSDKDSGEFAQEFWIQSKASEVIKLPIGEAFVSGDILFYYNDAQTIDGKNTKTAEIYLFHDLSSSVAQYNPNKNFTKIFMTGKEIAFELDGGYYVLSYTGASAETQFFKLENLALESLDGGYQAPLKMVNGVAVFTVPEGEIKIDINYNKTPAIVEFTGIGEKELLTATFAAENLTTVLNIGEYVKVKEITYNICDNPTYENFNNKVLLCVGLPPAIQLGDWTFDDDTNLWVRELVKDQLYEIDGMLVEFTNDAAKKVSFSSVINIDTTSKTNPQKFDWAELIDNLNAGRNPIFSWNDQFLELQGNANTLDLSLINLADDLNYPIQIQSSTEGERNGTIMVKENLLFIEQVPSGFDIDVNIYPLPQKLVTVDGFNFTDKSTQYEITCSIEGDIYKIHSNTIPFQDTPIYAVAIRSNDNEILMSYFILPENERKLILLPDGSIITTTITEKGEIIIKK
jgi:hypothetical protein